MHLIILILGLLLLPHASALRCYMCHPGQTDCTKTEVCDTKLDRCAAAKINNLHIKGCSTEALCIAAAVSGGSCCDSDLCNGASISAVSLVVLAAPLVSVALFN